MINWVRNHWRANGTKLLGVVTSAYSTVTALLAVLSASPDVQFLLPHKYFAMLAVGNAVLGVLTLRRGFTNTRNLNGP